MNTVHRPVLLGEIVEYLAGEGAENVGAIFDGTLGAGGHSAALLERLPNAALLGVDRDDAALKRAANRLEGCSGRCFLAQGSFDELTEIWKSMPVEMRKQMGDENGDAPRFDRMLLDLGISSDQLSAAERGFAFAHDGPLDMRMNQRGGATAADVLNSSEEGELRRLFRIGGVNDGFSRVLAREIVRRRPFTRTSEFAALCEELMPKRLAHRAGGRARHAATLPFQALRIHVNDESGALERFLEIVPAVLAPNGRLAIISFHSLEDKAVAQHMRRWARPGPGDERRAGPAFGKLLTKHAVVPGDEETAANPRARSARLRVFQRAEQ